MSTIAYAPIIEGKLPAFVKPSDVSLTNATLTVPYLLNRAVGTTAFDEMQVMVKTVTTGSIVANTKTTSCKILNSTTRMYEASFQITQVTNKLNVGDYYKVQVAFVDKDTQLVGPWSTVGIVKYTAQPTLAIENLKDDQENINPSEFTGIYETTDVTEKVYSYKFTIYDENNQVYDTSGWKIHNSSTDEIISGKLRNKMRWLPVRSLKDYKKYKVAIEVSTTNDYKCNSGNYIITAAPTVNARIPAKLLATPDYDNGCVALTLIPEKEKDEQVFSGSFAISRYTERTNSWHEVCRFNMLAQKPSEIGLIWTDYTLEHGERYLYAIQAYNSKGLFSNRMYHVLKNPDIYNSGPKYLEKDEKGQPYYIVGDFEDIFLTDGERQLKIRFNPKVSSYKPTILESKLETIGSKYPYIFRNGQVNYKEFPISGLLSYLMDEKELFMSGVYHPGERLSRTETPAAAATMVNDTWVRVPEQGTKLTTDNFYRERQFKMAALDWLTNGKPKLFRSPGEGNCIVKLMNVSLSPNETLGRMLHTFNATAYEIDECNFETLDQYDLLAIPKTENRTMKFGQVVLSEVMSGGTIWEFSSGLYHVYITDASPGTRYNITFADGAPQTYVSYVIGLTGSLYLDVDTYPVIKIELCEGDISHTATLHYGYYDMSVPDTFSHIANITCTTEIAQVIGYDKDKNIITDRLEDIRREVGNFYGITIRPRHIVNVSYADGSYYRDGGTTVITQWEPIAIYRYNNAYYSGRIDPSTLIGTTQPKKQIKINDLHILDLTENKEYKTSDSYSLGDPSRAEIISDGKLGKVYTPISGGCYYVKADLGEIESIKITPGVYVDLSYTLKEIIYSVEEDCADVKLARLAWEAKKNDATATDLEKQLAYDNFVNKLTEALENPDFAEDNYAL